jgi:uncharacterized membrane protein YfcA
MNRPPSASSRPQRIPHWDVSAIRAGGLLALLIAVPLWVASSWSLDQGNWALTALFTLGALVGFVLGAACAAWIQRLGLPLAHGLVTAAGTYVIVQVVVTAYRLGAGITVNWFGVVFYITVAAGAGLIGGFIGMRLRSAGFVPSSERRLDHLDDEGSR